jgi:hypothetical protein
MCADTRKKGSINTPLELAILNQIDRFNLAIDVIDRVPRLRSVGAHVKEWLKGQIIASINYAHSEGIDREEIREAAHPAEGPLTCVSVVQTSGSYFAFPKSTGKDWLGLRFTVKHGLPYIGLIAGGLMLCQPAGGTSQTV